jgi:methionyl aminopeptidase
MSNIDLKTPEEIELMAEGGRRLAYILAELKKAAKPGVTTGFLDMRARELLDEVGCEAAFLNYKPSGADKAFPAALCISVNEIIIHGLPSDRILKEGDVVTLDMGLIHEGFYLDAAISVGIGKVSKEVSDLLRATRESLEAGIKAAKPGKTLGDVGAAIQERVERDGFSVAQGLIGHGIGRNLHEDPNVFNVGRRGEGLALKPGMVLAIEPMAAAGKGKIKQLKDDTFVTADGSMSAHFEHTVAITKDGPRVLTVI